MTAKTWNQTSANQGDSNMYAFCHSHCGACGRLFSYNPKRVPSLNNTAFCKSCVDEANSTRKDMGLEPHPIHPDAYEPINESEL
jgi:hypothetical protein